MPAKTDAPPASDKPTDEFGDPKTSDAKPEIKPDAKPSKPEVKAAAPPVKMNVVKPAALQLPKELQSKKAMTKYVAQWGFTFKDYENLSFTTREREAYTHFAKINNRVVPKEVFTAALRMWFAGPTPGAQYPIAKAENQSLDELALN